MKSFKLVSLLIILSIISTNFQSCSSSNSQENAKSEESSNPKDKNTNTKETPTSPNVTSTNATTEKTADETSIEKNTSPQEVETETSIESGIQFIKDKFAIITNASEYIVDSTSVECNQGFSRIERRSTKEGELRYMLENSCGDHGCLTTNYYFWDNELIFIFQQNYYYAGNSDYMKEYRTYFKNKKMFLCLEKDISTTKGYEELMKILKKTSNKTIDCTPNKRPGTIQKLIDLDLKKAKDFFCS